MEENLVGYLLQALDGETQREVETYLRDHPETVKRLQLLREALEPLASDREIEAPPGLWLRTMELCASAPLRETKHLTQSRRGAEKSQLSSCPSVPASFGRAPHFASRFRRADVLVAACLLICLSFFIPPVLSSVHYYHDIIACKNNLRGFYSALEAYSEHHNGEFPNVATAARPPRNIAGISMALLSKEGLLQKGLSIKCPSKGSQAPVPLHYEQIVTLEPEVFQHCGRALAGSYGYTLGYRDETGNIFGLRSDMDLMPLLADQPPAEILAGNNSPNHGGRGQNVLFTGGHCKFVTSRNVGPDGDDIFLNQNNEVKAGCNRWDAVLGDSMSRP